MQRKLPNVVIWLHNYQHNEKRLYISDLLSMPDGLHWRAAATILLLLSGTYRNKDISCIPWARKIPKKGNWRRFARSQLPGKLRILVIACSFKDLYVENGAKDLQDAVHEFRSTRQSLKMVYVIPPIPVRKDSLEVLWYKEKELLLATQGTHHLSVIPVCHLIENMEGVNPYDNNLLTPLAKAQLDVALSLEGCPALFLQDQEPSLSPGFQLPIKVRNAKESNRKGRKRSNKPKGHKLGDFPAWKVPRNNTEASVICTLLCEKDHVHTVPKTFKQVLDESDPNNKKTTLVKDDKDQHEEEDDIIDLYYDDHLLDLEMDEDDLNPEELDVLDRAEEYEKRKT